MNEIKNPSSHSDPVNEEETSLPTEPIPADDDSEKTEVIEVTVPDNSADAPKDENGQTIDQSETLEKIDKITNEIRDLLKIYKVTMWAIVASIVVYLLVLFVFKSKGLLIVCIVMIVLAIINTRYSRKIQKLAAERTKLKKSIESPTSEAAAPTDGSLQVGTDNSSEAIVTNAKSLNDLPREYTVLDHVEFPAGEVDHVVVSPYGIALIGDPKYRADMESVLQEIQIDSPIFVYNPDEEISKLVEQIQMEKIVELTEAQCMTICQKLLGLK